MNKTSDRFRYDAAFLSLGPAFDQHLQIQFFGSEAFERVLAYCLKTFNINISKEPFFKIGIAKFARVVVTQHTLHVCGREYFPDNIKDRVIIQCVANFLEFFQ